MLAQLRNGCVQHVFDLLGENKFHFFGHGLGQFGEVLFVFQRQNHSLDTDAPRGQDFLFDASNRQHHPVRVISPVIAVSTRTGYLV